MGCKNCPYNSEDNAWCEHKDMNWRDSYIKFESDDKNFVRNNCPLEKEEKRRTING